MGRSFTPRYVLRIDRHTLFGSRLTPMTWDVKQLGKPTIENVDKHVTAFENSLVHGPNKHLGIFSIAECHVWDQKNKKEVCRWVRRIVRPNEALFQVIA